MSTAADRPAPTFGAVVERGGSPVDRGAQLAELRSRRDATRERPVVIETPGCRAERGVAFGGAHEDCRDEATRAATRVRLVVLAWRSNPAAAATRLPRLLDDLGTGRLAPAEILPAVSALCWWGYAPSVTAAIDRLVSAAGAEQPAVAVLDVARRWLALHDPDLATRVPEPGAEPPGAEPPAPVDPVTGAFADAADALTAVVEGRSTPEVAVASTAALRRAPLADGTLQPLVFGLVALVCSGALDTAADWTDRLLDDCVRRHAPSWRAVLVAVRAEIALRRGDLRGAAGAVDRAFTLLPAAGWGTLVALPWSTRLQAASAMGRREQVEESLRMPVPDGLEGTLLGAHLLRARGRAALIEGRSDTALHHFTACGRQLRPWGDGRDRWLRWRVDAAEACLALDQPHLARTFVEEELRGDPDAAPGDGRLLLAHARSVAAPRRLAMLERAVTVAERGDDRLLLATVWAELGRRHRELGDASRAHEALDTARRQAEACGAEMLCRQLVPGRDTAPGEPAHRGGAVDGQDTGRITAVLSQAEARVAALAAAGHLNREIAATLFVTVSTVEQHLTRIYRKLRIKRRSELATRLTAVDLVHDRRGDGADDGRARPERRLGVVGP